MPSIGILLVIFRFFSEIQRIRSVPIDNGLTSDPEIRCGQDSMTVVFRTKRDFEGNVYIDGRFRDNACKVSGTGKNQIEIQISYAGSCGIRRKRQVSPSGMAIEATAVIMFHRAVLTKVDRAFNIQCFYMQADKSVTANLDVSMIPTVALSNAVRMPNCTYQVLQSPTGGIMKYAQVGDQVYHKWTCVGGDSEMFCITVHSCNVEDGQGQVIQILDNSGCAIDRYLLQNLEYTSDTMAGRESHVFKFADKPTVYFNCQIRLVTKDGSAVCPRPKCPELTRGKRDINLTKHIHDTYLPTDVANLDVYANKLTILDIKELEPGTVSEIESADTCSHNRSLGNVFDERETTSWCFRPWSTTVVGSIAASLIFISGCLFGGGCVLRCKSKNR